MTDRKKIARIIDANLNRACEGSRVLEEIARFIKGDGNLAKQVKDMRHEIISTVKEFGFDYLELLDARDSEADVGREHQGKLEINRKEMLDTMAANFSRIEEALRVIEEFGRPVNPEVADTIKTLRYKVYSLEKRFGVAHKIQALSVRENQSDNCIGPIIIFVLIALALIYIFYPKPVNAAVTADYVTHSQGIIASDTVWETPYYVTDTGIPGPVVLITGGIHGNEPAGFNAADEFLTLEIDNGKLIIIPRANQLGIKLDSRYLPLLRYRDLNRNFPNQNDMIPKGELAKHLWGFICDLNPDWHIDLHESVNFRRLDETRCGNSIIYYPVPGMTNIVTAMIDAANTTVTDSNREFVLLRYPIDGSLARACGEQLGISAMILETTRKQGQPLELRIQQHVMMVKQCLLDLNMISNVDE